MRSLLFWDFTQRSSVVADVSVQSIGDILKGKQSKKKPGTLGIQPYWEWSGQ
jgi:hypothetical protein